MTEIYVGLIGFLIIWYLFFLRKVAETARQYAKRHCSQQGLQFISIARTSSSWALNKRQGLHLVSLFEFEFSGDTTSSYTGTLQMRGNRLEKVELPPYSIS
ncbi:DUF3301 domain-containing protein [Thalassotalea sp. PS06]|uniref:DUF3301 domain-containing protein n=1 Tax=Thalassotalea sp. PS06 TaxID=2594005 RepID=UPI001163CC57|nr:DUF3301 domain-containing protein [Thalassotalea sp. PS06]QDP01669.1 DUF3301 domain-containing protein [Thalassotalea sp. PS06]